MFLKRKLQKKVQDALTIAGVGINSSRPWDLVIHDDRFYSKVLLEGALGLGESYMDGWWDCAELAQLFCRLLKAHLEQKYLNNWVASLDRVKARIMNCQGKFRAARNVHQHYDLGTDLFRNMLGRSMIYSSLNWEHAENLEDAAEAKLEYVCRKMDLRSGQKVLDIGCGWGGFAKYASQKYGVRVVGITLSEEQTGFALQSCSDLPVEIRCQDYRELDEPFDRVVSLGMFEHVGYKNYRQYMEIVRRCLKPGGIFFLNTIGAGVSERGINPWTDKYIFPGGMIPSIAQIGAAIDGLFLIEELQDWAEFYDKTLVTWFENFQLNWHKIKGRYGDRFYRMWKYYLLSSAGAFRSKEIQDWQIVLAT